MAIQESVSLPIVNPNDEAYKNKDVIPQGEEGSSPKEETQEKTQEKTRGEETQPPEEPQGEEAQPSKEPAEESQPPRVTDILKSDDYKDLFTGEVGINKEVLGKFAQEIGCDPETAELIATGYRAKAQVAVHSVYDAAGGSLDDYKDLVDWASKNPSGYSQAKAKAFNDAIASEDTSKIIDAVKDLRAAYVEANGSLKSERNTSLFRKVNPSQSVSHNKQKAIAGGAVPPFADMSELVAAQKDPRYAQGGAYTKWVYARALKSNI